MAVRLLLLLLLTTPSILFVKCSKSDNAPTQASQQAWTVSGKTYLVGSTDPLPGVLVKCAGLSSTSGSDGRYEIRGVPRGAQILNAEKAGCDAYSRSIEVNADRTEFIYLSFKSTNLSGFVTNSVDGAIKGAKVAVRGFVTYTDVSGLYQFLNIPRGTDTLYISHPNYFAFDTALSLNASIEQFDIVLKRDSIIQITTMLNTYVDESLPDQAFGLPDRLYLRANGYDSLGHYHSGIRQHIYIYFDIPQIFAYPSVSIVEASLELCTDFPYPTTRVETFLVTSHWTYTIAYNRQPTVGSLLYYGSVGDTASAKYCTLLGADGFNQLVTVYRTYGQFYGVVIQGGGINRTAFYSVRVTQNRPRIAIRVRY